MTQLVRFLSDIHNEFEIFTVPLMPEDKETILVLAGDIDLVFHENDLFEFFKTMSNQFKEVLYVLGNHEYYGNWFNDLPNRTKDILKSLTNVHVMENEVFKVDKLAFVAATLWTDYDNENPLLMVDAERSISDYIRIRSGDGNDPDHYFLTTKEVLSVFKTSKQFIFEECKKLKDDGYTVIVVTHHSPSYKSVTEPFIGDSLNGIFHNNLNEEILDAQPDVWYHGHIHQSVNYCIGETEVFSNPRGYVFYDLNPDFNPKLRGEY